MNDKILNMLRKPYQLLIWALICGLAYLSLAARFIFEFTERGGGILVWFFFPAIVCGAALIIIKGIKKADENGNERAMLTAFWAHVFIIAMGAVFFASMLI